MQIGESKSLTTIGDLTGRGIGLILDGAAAKLTVHDGSTLTTTASLATIITQKINSYTIISDGAGNAELLINDVSVGTTTGAPNADGAVVAQAVNLSCKNGTTTMDVIADLTDYIKFLID